MSSGANPTQGHVYSQFSGIRQELQADCLLQGSWQPSTTESIFNLPVILGFVNKYHEIGSISS
jgi:hypothetical protein